MDEWINKWLVAANGIRVDDWDEQLISFGWWHLKWMAEVSEQLTSTNDALRG